MRVKGEGLRTKDERLESRVESQGSRVKDERRKTGVEGRGRDDVLVAFEDVSCIYFLGHIIKDAVVAVGNDGMTLFLEFIEIIHNL